MKLDSLSTHSTASEVSCVQMTEYNEVSEGKSVSEPDKRAGAEEEVCSEVNDVGKGE